MNDRGKVVSFIICSTLMLAADWSISLVYWTVLQYEHFYSLFVNVSIQIQIPL